jgi:putative nucleotidyltransferase with HDIG domain
MTMDQPANFEAKNRLRSIVNRTTELAPLKSVAARAIQLAEDERSAAMDLATVISSDLALTAKLLRLSNSAYYGYSRRIGNVREAVILLGMRTVRSVAISSGIIDSFSLAAPHELFVKDLFWAHSVCVGLVAEVIARETRIARPEDAFTAGVLHDIGKLAMMLAEPAAFAEVVDLVTEKGKRYGEAERAVFGIGHEQVGWRLAQRWKFPEPLCEAIRRHHPQRAQAGLEGLSDIVAVANLACNREGLACGFDWTNDSSRHPVQSLPDAADNALAKVHGGMQTIEGKARAFLIHVTGSSPRWYSLRGDDVLDGDLPDSPDATRDVA